MQVKALPSYARVLRKITPKAQLYPTDEILPGQRQSRCDQAVDAGVPGMCRAQIGCAVIVPWCAWDGGWQALQVIDC
jgi:hypothetical protein